jgi:hypothetical protein
MLARVPAGDLIDRMRHEPKLRSAEVLHSDTTWRPGTVLAWARHRGAWAVLIRWPDGHDDWREYDPRHIRPRNGPGLAPPHLFVRATVSCAGQLSVPVDQGP